MSFKEVKGGGKWEELRSTLEEESGSYSSRVSRLHKALVYNVKPERAEHNPELVWDF